MVCCIHRHSQDEGLDEMHPRQSKPAYKTEQQGIVAYGNSPGLSGRIAQHYFDLKRGTGEFVMRKPVKGDRIIYGVLGCELEVPDEPRVAYDRTNNASNLHGFVLLAINSNTAVLLLPLSSAVQYLGRGLQAHLWYPRY